MSTPEPQCWVLLRGLIREQRHWETFPARLCAALPPGSRVICVDLPGNGLHFRERSPLSITAMVDAARADLARQGVQGPVCLLALSLGAMAAFEWMSRYPQEIQRAVLLNTSLSAYSPFWQRLRPHNYLRIVRDVLFRHSQEYRERMILEITTNLIADREVYVRRWTGYAHDQPVSVSNALRQLLAAARYQRPENLPTCPVLLLNGGGDRLVNPQCSEAIAAGMNLPLRRHPQAGHDLSLDASEWVIAEVLR